MVYRNAKDLIAELEEEASRHCQVTMVVSFETSTIFIQADDPARLEMLKEALQAGGRPIGLLAADKENVGLTPDGKQAGILTIMSLVYPENTGELREQCDVLMTKLTESLRDSLLQ